MPAESVWQHIDVPLPELVYQNTTAAGQGKGSTEWAAHSHTPIGVEQWDGFEELVQAEGQNPRNQRIVDLDFSRKLQDKVDDFDPISREEDVTNQLQILLGPFSNQRWDLSGGIIFSQQNQQIIGKPDLVAQVRDTVGLGAGHASDYASPPPGSRAEVRRNNTKLIVSLYRIPFETKPYWKFRFLRNTQYIIDEWEIPNEFDAASMQANASLPKSWSAAKKKVFHLVRQLYGQMVADKRRYGIMHTYELWFFCKRTPEGVLKISRAYEKTETSPSIFQAIKTMVGFEDHVLDGALLHPQSASKVPAMKKQRTQSSSTPEPPSLPPAYGNTRSPGSRDVTGNGGNGTGDAVAEGKNLASSLYPWDCDVYDYTDSVLLLTTTKDPTVIIKLQSDPRKKHVARDMKNEAAIYEALDGNESVKEFIPSFRGYSTHLGVAMTCIEKELDDFDDIGIENLSDALKLSAVHAVKALSAVGILHNDIELRNIVRSKKDPSRAKIIDFGRAMFSSDRNRLAKQVEHVKTLLTAKTENSKSGLLLDRGSR